MADSKDKELSTNKEVKRGDSFQDRVDIKETVLDTIKELLVSTTEEVFKNLGVEKNDSHAGVYGDGSTYGAGAKENTFSVKIAGKTKTNLTKEIIFGAKNMISVINIVLNGNIAKIEYKSPESGFFRGIDADGKTYMINEKMDVSVDNMNEFKSVIKKSFKKIAERELGFMISTKKGVEDKTEKSTTSVVESTKPEYLMKKLTIKELFSDDNELSESKAESKDKNAIDLDKTTPPIKSNGDKKVFFDEEEKEKNVQKEITSTGPAISGSAGGFKDGANSGSGGYNAKNAWKKTSYAKAQEAKENKPTVTKDWNVVPKNKNTKQFEVEVPEKKSTEKDNLNVETPENKSSGMVDIAKKSNFDPNNNNPEWKNTNQTKAPATSKDNFWQEVKLEPGSGYVPVGMKQNFIAGMHNASASDLKSKGYAEGEEKKGELLKENTEASPIINSDRKNNLTKRKFFSEQDNKTLGVNKRYLITEKTTDEYEKERWKKLSQFKSRESIKEAEEMNDYFETLENELPIPSIIAKEPLNENVNNISDDIFSDIKEEPRIEADDHSDTVIVEKPGSKFGTEYKFFKKDFLNENKKYILDLNSRVFVPNPNSK